jgi:GT2 family glycosyltransferase
MTISKDKVSIIIVNWNTRRLLLDCIKSILDNTKNVDFEIIVVDNASSDGSVDAVSNSFPEVRLIASDKNLGFAAGCNRGFEVSNGNFIFYLNPDTLVDSEALFELVCFLKDKREVGIVGPLLIDKNYNSQISSFGIFPSAKEAFLHAIRIWRIAPKSKIAKDFLKTPENKNGWVYTGHLLGAALLARRELIEDLNGFDEKYFLFLEETDLCFRTLKAGWKLAYNTNIKIIHLGEQSMMNILHKSGGLYIRSYNTYCKKHRIGYINRIAVNMSLTTGIIIEAAVALIKHKSFKRSFGSLRALWYGYVIKP